MSKAPIVLGLIALVLTATALLLPEATNKISGVHNEQLCNQTHKETLVGNTRIASCDSIDGYTLNNTHCCTPIT